MTYQPIESYGIIGDLQAVALVGMNGSIDWFCFPHFDSPSVFGRILDDKKGCYFQIAAFDAAKQYQTLLARRPTRISSNHPSSQRSPRFALLPA